MESYIAKSYYTDMYISYIVECVCVYLNGGEDNTNVNKKANLGI